jgi:hypothetical protein
LAPPLFATAAQKVATTAFPSAMPADHERLRVDVAGNKIGGGLSHCDLPELAGAQAVSQPPVPEQNANGLIYIGWLHKNSQSFRDECPFGARRPTTSCDICARPHSTDSIRASCRSAEDALICIIFGRRRKASQTRAHHRTRSTQRRRRRIYRERT